MAILVNRLLNEVILLNHMNKRILTGKVISASMQKTIVVEIDRQKTRAPYPKPFTVSKKYHVHDEAGKGKVGDVVRFEEARPMSKTKRWRLIA